MKKVKVAEVITRMDWGGSPDIYRILAGHLDPATYDITLIIGQTGHPTKKTRDFLAGFGGKVISVEALKREIDPLVDLAALGSLLTIFAREKFDVVHTHTAKAGALGRIAAGLCRVPAVIHTPHGHNLYGYFDETTTGRIIKAETFLSRWTDKIIALTELEKKDYIKFNVAGEKKIKVIYQGLELDKYLCGGKERHDLKKFFRIGQDDNVVGMVGRLERVKGPEIFVEAAAAVAKKLPNTKFILAGEGSLRKILEEKAALLGLGDKMIFAGWREDVPEILSILDMMVLPSLNEAVGMALIEAQAEGVPVVAARVGGVPEVVKDGKTGVLVSPGNAGELADAIIGLLSDKGKLKDMGQAGALWVRGRFRAEDMARKTSELYMETLHKKGRFISERI